MTCISMQSEYWRILKFTECYTFSISLFFTFPASLIISIQGSRDNMSVVLVCLPNAPKVSEEAVRREAELDKFLESRVEGK